MSKSNCGFSYTVCIDASIKRQFWDHEYINELLKPDFKLKLEKTPTLKLGLILVLTVNTHSVH